MVVGEFTQEADVVILGGGPGGYTAALRAAELGLTTVIVDPRAQLGGVCLHEGCIPSKTLLYIAESISIARNAARFGVHFPEPTIKLDQVKQWVDDAVAKLAGSLSALCRQKGIEHVQGAASFVDAKHLLVRCNDSTKRFKFRKAIIATGVEPAPLPAAIKQDNPNIIGARRALNLDHLPARTLVVGSTAVAVEVATIYAVLGSEVTLATVGAALIDDVDPDLLRPLDRRLKQILASLRLDVAIESVSESGDGVLTVIFAGKGGVASGAFERIIIALPGLPRTGSLDLDKAQVELDTSGFVRIDERLRTSNARIFAVGDITGCPFHANRAIHQGRIAAEVIAGYNTCYDARCVPRVIFTDPQIAWCGLTEQQARAQAVPFDVKRIPWGASGRAVGMGRSEGITKLILDPDTQLILGVGLVGPHATEMIAQGSLAIEMGAEANDIAATIHPHPTLSELMMAAAQQAVP